MLWAGSGSDASGRGADTDHTTSLAPGDHGGFQASLTKEAKKLPLQLWHQTLDPLPHGVLLTGHSPERAFF